jgi:predicted  nucleic acid-binding Zn-ribbon protein
VEINFENLIHLQELDEQIRKVTSFLDSLPDHVLVIEAKIDESEKIVAEVKNSLSTNQKKRRDLEAAVGDKKTRIGKYRKQLNDVKTNKEYTSLLKEIEDVENDIEALEEEIITEMLAADDLESEIKTAEAKAATMKEELLKEKSLVLEQGKGQEQEKERLLGERQQLIPGIPSDLFGLYHQIFHKSSGTALSPVTDDFCSMCQIRVRPQVLNELIAQKDIILCENCGRILYWKPKK